MSIKIGSRIFSPTVFTTLLTMALIVLLISLGRWQLRRADEKRVLYESFAAGAGATLPVDLATPHLRRYQHIEAGGHFDPTRQILIDNMFDGERVGYYVITPFALTGGGWVLVNRGWVPLGRSRAERPAIPVGADTRQVRGRADNMPSPGIQMGTKAPLAPPYPVVAAFPSHADIAQLLGESSWSAAADLVLLDPGQPDGYVRHWSAPGFPPIRHIAYAVQWFALALTLFVIYIVTNLRRADAQRRQVTRRHDSSKAPGIAARGGMLIGLALLFFAPLGLAFYLYYGHGSWHPGARVNRGELVQPPRPLPALALPLWGSGSTDANFLKGKWTLLYVAFGSCSDACRTRLYDTRQVRLALDRDMGRVQRVLIAGDGCCDAQFLREQHPDLITIRADPAAAPLLALLPDHERRDGPLTAQAPRVYLIDPLGNLMMVYPAGARPKGMLEDMKRLLRLSSIG